MNKGIIKEEYAPDDFYRAFAIAMLRWQYVEHELYQLFHAIIQTPNVATSGALYYAQLSFGQKLNLVDSTAKVTLTDTSLARWKELRKELKGASNDRNVLAHLTAVADFEENGAFKLVLAPALFVPMQMIRKQNKKYDSKGCEHIAITFDELAKKVAAFTEKLSE